MKERSVHKTVRGKRAIDGAGVHLVRVIGGYRTVQDFDPFLMLDAFDSTNPDDYIAGFPFHPHRGIETVTYLVKGSMEHQDSLGNRSGLGNLDKPLSGKSATTNAQRWAQHGAENGKKNEAETFSSI